MLLTISVALVCGIFGHLRGGAARHTVSLARIASVNRYAGDSSLVKDLTCARAIPEASVGASNPCRGRLYIAVPWRHSIKTQCFHADAVGACWR